jgi:hypothetical protein
MEYEVSLVAPRVEVQADETRMLPERGQMKSTSGSHGHIHSRGVYSVDYALSAGKSGTNVSKPQHYIGSCGARDGGVLLGVRILTIGHECSMPHYVIYEPDYDNDLCVTVGTKSYSEKNAEEWAMETTETQGDISKEMKYEVIIRELKAESHQKEIELWAGDTKWITARATFKAKTGIHTRFTAQYVPKDMKEVAYHQVMDPHKAGNGGHQDQLGITGQEAIVESWKKGTHGQSQMIHDYVQDVRHWDAPEAMKKFSSHQMTDSPKELKGGLQDQLRITGLEDMVEYWKKGKQVQTQMIINLVQDSRSQDAPEAMEKLLSHQVMYSPKAGKGGPQEQLCITGPEATVKIWKKGTHGQYQMMSHSAQDFMTQEAPEDMEEIKTLDLNISTITEEFSSPQHTNCAGGYG